MMTAAITIEGRFTPKFRCDDEGYYVDEDAVSIGAFHASIAFAAGMDIRKPAISPSGRPMTVGDGEKPVLELFS